MLKRNKLPVFRIDEPLFATKDDKEYYERETKQIKHRGFAGSEIFALDYALACFLLPRLDAFRKNKESYPASLTIEEWHSILDHICWSLDRVIRDDTYILFPGWKKKGYDYLETELHECFVQEGLNLLGEYFRALWL